MLTTSPRIPSGSPSPKTFHYATAPRRSPQSTPSRLASASSSRRQSQSHSPSTSMTSPSLEQRQSSPIERQAQSQSQPQSQSSQAQAQPQPYLGSKQSPRQRHYVAVDAGTQYSPMESPKVKAVERAAAEGRLGNATAAVDGNTPPSNPPPAPRPQAINQAAEKQPIIVVELKPSSPSVPSSLATEPNLRSPGKRRKSSNPPVPPRDASASAGPDPENPSSPAAPKRQRQAPAPQKVLPIRYEFCGWEDMVKLIAHMLSELIETNDALALQSGSLTRFHSRTAPNISVLEYLNRLAKHATLTPPLLLSMVYYIDRLCALYPEFTINTLTVHRFLITAATVAAKGLSDSFWNNTTYARVGGVRVAELKLLELEFLYRVDWKIVPNPEVLVAYYRGLVERCPGYALEGEEEEENGDESTGKGDPASADVSGGDEESDEARRDGEEVESAALVSPGPTSPGA